MALLAIVMLAANLRAAITVVGPLLGPISRGYALGGTLAGLLTALPVLAFAACSPLALRLSRRVGIETALLGSLVVLVAGTVLRSLPAAGALFAGTLILAAGIAVANVLLPALVKARFPARQGTVTGLYVTAMGLLAAVASGVAVPLADAAPGGWRAALAAWAVPALLAALVWTKSARWGEPARAPVALAPMPWRSRVAWQVTAFMGLQSLGFYVMIGWLPSLLEAHRVGARAAGYELLAYQLVSVAATVALPPLIDRRADHRALALASAGCCAGGYLGLALAPGAALAWVLAAGLGSGMLLVLALSFVALRAAAPEQAAALSAMAQTVGYLLAAAGPLLFGSLHALTGGWSASLAMLIASAAALSAAAWRAGRAGARV
jgi:CP family cyanate transporter-like MFS transporter